MEIKRKTDRELREEFLKQNKIKNFTTKELRNSYVKKKLINNPFSKKEIKVNE